MRPYYEHAGITIYHGDCREVLPLVSGAHLVATDPPYNGVLEDVWDNQWPDDESFLAWLDDIAAQIDLALADNGTLYVFAAPRLASRVELQVGQRFSVIGNAIWDKADGRKGAGGSGLELAALRTYWAADTERVVIAEKKLNAAFRTADDQAKDACGFWSACEAGKRSVFGEYLRSEFDLAGVTNREIAALFPSRTGGLTGCVSNWLLGFNIPTEQQYHAMRAYLNRDCGDHLRREYDDLRREYDDLRREYDDLRREYDDLRREYDDLRRPFFVQPMHQWGSIWRFPIERDRLHPAQKPSALMAQMIAISSRPGDVVVDPFMGSGTTLVAAKRLGRKAIGVDLNEQYCEMAVKRLTQSVLDFELPPAITAENATLEFES